MPIGNWDVVQDIRPFTLNENISRKDLQPCLFLQLIDLNDEFIEVIKKNILIVLLERMCW